jgi:hypothetical protein
MAQDEAGFVLVFYAVCIPVLLGLVGLVIDGGRLMSLDAQSAAFSDAAALAAAAHLDRSPGAIPAARAAALALRNRPRFAETGGDRLAFRFAARLSDFSNATYSLPDGAGAEAAYVEVTTAEASLTGSFLALVGARPGPVRRRAVAESQYYACDVTPAVLCHPDPAAFAATARPGRQYRLTMDGNKVAGSIALLDKPGAMDGRQSLRDLADDQPAFCYAEGVRLRTTTAPVEFDDAVNVRFDRYQGRAGPVAPDLAVYPPAPNIIDGRAYQSCVAPLNFYDTTPPFALPRDSGYQGLVPTGPWDKGTGDWRIAPALTGLGARTALDEYLFWNHADKGPEIQSRLRDSPTRWDLYLAELGLDATRETVPVDTRGYAATATMPTGGPLTSPTRDRATPFCYAGTRPATAARRRILYLSVADCGAFPQAATASTLSRRVAKVFLTEPSDLGAVLVEFVGLLTPTHDDGKLRHIVQLVRTD